MKQNLWLLCCLLAAPGWAGAPARVMVDAREVGRKLVHVRETLPVSPGPLTLLYPQWIPGEHGPTGPILELAGLKLTAGGSVLGWRRDALDLYAIHLNVPDGASELFIEFDNLLRTGKSSSTSDASASQELAILAWNQMVLQPQQLKADDWQIEPTLRMPAGWSQASALRVTGTDADGAVHFSPVSFTTLVDSPVQIGRYVRRIALGTQLGAEHWVDIAADSEAALAIKPETERAFARLVREVTGLHGARHYERYDFLLTLSDHIATFGLEHHASSDDRRKERYLIDDDLLRAAKTLLPHEMFHSWNGKYRRPAGLVTGGFNAPMQDELLWVYEGMTQYYANVLTSRSGLRTPEEFRSAVAYTAALMDAQSGRNWKPLQDTADATPLPDRRDAWEMYRRGNDFYNEGLLLWLEADTLIRSKTRNKKSLDDFCRLFFGGANTGVQVKPYTADEVFATLNQVLAYDWAGYFHQRLTALDARAPLGGIGSSGWKLVYRDTPGMFQKASEAASESWDLRWSIGVTLNKDGDVRDVRLQSPSDRAGLAPGMKLIAVNGRKYSKNVLKAALDARRPFELLTEADDRYQSFKLDYADGQRYPDLERDPSRPDLLSIIGASKFQN